MKKLFYLSFALVIATGLSAQTVSKSGKGTVSTNSNTTTTHSSGSGSGTGSSRSTNYSGNSGASHNTGVSGTSNSSTRHSTSGEPEKSLYQPSTATKGKKDEMKVSEKKDVVVREGSGEPGGINKVGEDRQPEPINYQDKNKVDQQSTGEETDPVTNTPTTVSRTENKMGLSDSIKSQNPVRINGVRVVQCNQDSLDNVLYADRLLRNYEGVDWTNYKECHKTLPNKYRFKVDCAEFENSSDERKRYILNNTEFYDITDLRKCEAYYKFVDKR